MADVTLPLGTSTILLTADDGQAPAGTDTVTITVRDTTPPRLICPTVAPVECASVGGTQVEIQPASVADACDASPSILSSRGYGGADASGIYPLGQSEVGITARDSSGNEASCAFPVTVRDTTPPQIALSLDTSTLWPPNHRMVDVGASVVASDSCSTPSVALASVTSSETDDASGLEDGNTSSDIQGADLGTLDPSFQLRAERSGSGPGRTYAVSYAAVDSSGNSSQTRSFVVAPHDMGGSTEPLDVSA
ncbi:MAG: HYR domain-containing protein, partial [Acidobacteria bacterium]|nr:HYR domain-containing protein [Acidobacteriota bacterium]